MNLRELVSKRSVGALPVGGRYRVIDFVLSNMVNSGIRNIGVIPRRNYHSMMDHLGSGKEWDLNRKNDGLFIIPPYDTEENTGSYRGMIDTLKGAGSYIRRTQQKYCLLSGTSTLYNQTYNDMYDYHISSGADITMLYSVEDGTNHRPDPYQDVRLKTNEEGRVTEMRFHGSTDGYEKMGMGIYLIKKDLLLYLINDGVSRGKINFIRDIVMSNLGSLRVFGLEHKGYVGRLSSVASYYKLNMDFLNPLVQRELFGKINHIYTKIKDEAPAKYQKGCAVKNSLLGSGCVIEGCVENSILFRGVTVARGATVRNSIIMQGSEIYSGASLTSVILDKMVTVRPNSVLAGSADYPIIIPKGANV